MIRGFLICAHTLKLIYLSSRHSRKILTQKWKVQNDAYKKRFSKFVNTKQSSVIHIIELGILFKCSCSVQILSNETLAVLKSVCFFVKYVWPTGFNTKVIFL